MIQEVSVQTYTCRKCQSEKIVKNGTNRYGSQQYLCRECGASGVLKPRHRYTGEVCQWHTGLTEQKETILKAYRERPSMRGIERIFGVSRQTLAVWLKKG